MTQFTFIGPRRLAPELHDQAVATTDAAMDVAARLDAQLLVAMRLHGANVETPALPDDLKDHPMVTGGWRYDTVLLDREDRTPDEVVEAFITFWHVLGDEAEAGRSGDHYLPLLRDPATLEVVVELDDEVNDYYPDFVRPAVAGLYALYGIRHTL